MAMQTPKFLATQTYTAMDLRGWTMDMGVQQGVVGRSDLVVTQDLLGGNLTLMVWGGSGLVRGTTTVRQGLYNVFLPDSQFNVAVPANSSGNPRIDQVIARVYDATDGASALNGAFVELLAGTPSVGATLANRTGAAALPAHSMRLADVLVPNAATFIPDANIQDRRTFAGGFHMIIERTANAASGLNYTTNVATQALIDATNLHPQVECGEGTIFLGSPMGNRIRLSLRGSLAGNTAGMQTTLFWQQNGAQSGGGHIENVDVANNFHPISIWRDLTIGPGANKFGPSWKVGSAGQVATFVTDTGNFLTLTLEELVGRGGDNKAKPTD